ncbi:MAG: hypothetical protein LBH43_12640, partial [Treponema sp.]|nr:hypothetical protein [Treponema sp.]
IKLYRTISLAFADDGYESTCAQLKDLAYEFATKGKGDDTNIAGIINIEEIKKAALDYKWKEKMEAAEEERDRKKAEEAENEASGEASHAEDDTGKPIAGPADTGFKPTAEPEVSTLAGNNRAASRAYEKTMSTKI